MKISEFENERALDLLADLLDPMTAILGDAEIQKIYREKPKVELVKYIIKNYKEEIITILAILEDVPRDEYKCNIFTLPRVILNLLEDDELIGFFTQSAQASELFGDATGTTKATTKK